MPDPQPFGEHALLDVNDGLLQDGAAARLRETVRAIADRDDPHLVLHFHGGLVSAKKGRKAAEGLYPFLAHGDGTVPLSVIWHTGPTDLLGQVADQLREIVTDDILRQLARHVSRFILARRPQGASRGSEIRYTVSMQQLPRDLHALAAVLDQAEAMPATLAADARSAATEASPDGGLTGAELEAFEQDLQDDELLASAVAGVVAGMSDAPEETVRSAAAQATPRPALVSREIQAELVAATEADGERSIFSTAKAVLVIARHGVAVVRRVYARLRDGRDHGLYTTIIEEILSRIYVDRIGGHLWRIIKQDPDDAFGGSPRHAGPVLVGAIAEYWQTATDAGRSPRLTLVGHSAGSIYIARLLARLDDALPEAARLDVVLLAPAASFKTWSEHTAVIRKRVRKLRLFGLSDDAERGYWEFPGYQGSLLYAVAGLFERPSGSKNPADADVALIGMERYYDDHFLEDEGVREARTLIESFGAPIWVPKSTDGTFPPVTVGRGSESQTHGDFDNDDATKETLRHVLHTEWRAASP